MQELLHFYTLSIVYLPVTLDKQLTVEDAFMGRGLWIGNDILNTLTLDLTENSGDIHVHTSDKQVRIIRGTI